MRITKRRWLVLVCSYCNRRGADVMVDVDRVRNENHYMTPTASRVATHSEKGEMKLREWMDQKGWPQSESEAAYVVRNNNRLINKFLSDFRFLDFWCQNIRLKISANGKIFVYFLHKNIDMDI